MAWATLTRLGACSARGRGRRAAAACGTCGITCGRPPSAGADSARHTRGTDARPWSASRGQHSAKGRCATALTLRTSRALTATMCDA
eukprot:4674244-Alexandrium_andersonii.AAC.1